MNKILNALVCTDINGATSFQGMPLFKKDPFVSSCTELFTANSIVIEPLMDADHSIMVNEDERRYVTTDPADALNEALKNDNNEIWVIGNAPEMENLLLLCQNLIVVEVHETAPQADSKFVFDYSGWKKTTAKECVSGKRKIGVYFYENPGVKDAA